MTLFQKALRSYTQAMLRESYSNNVLKTRRKKTTVM